MTTKNTKLSKMNISETMACVAYAETGQECDLAAPSASTPEVGEQHHDWSTPTRLERDLACVSFFERDQACPLVS
ncbi:MAG: hypothetical protein KKB70_04740 [Proteobacteria bacterium]|nr:hypothetical protein [Pseudomonadota bacterium]MBU1611903.1 hypothetical protein [Pseudomonadota bacterium]